MPYYIKGGPPVGLRVPLGPYFATGQQVFGERLYGLQGTRGLGWVLPLLKAAAWAGSGIAAYDYFTEDEIADQWRDNDTFNAVGASINGQFELINARLSECPGAWNQESAAFRQKWGEWSTWWGDKGDRWTDADAGEVNRLRDFAIAVNGWGIRVGRALQAQCPDRYENYPYKTQADLQVDPAQGTITAQQRVRLEEAKRQAQIQKQQQQAQAPEFERWNKLLSGVGWVLVGAITLGAVAFGYRVYKDVKR